MGTYAIEGIRRDHPALLTSAFEACAVARCRAAGTPPWRLGIHCGNLPRNGTGIRSVGLTWQERTEEASRKAERTYQPRRVIEDAAIGVCAAGLAALREGAISEVCDHGTGVDFWVDGRRAVLEVSGTGTGDQAKLRERHRVKVQQLEKGSLYHLGYPGYVFVVAFGIQDALLTYHAPEGEDHA